MTINETCSCGAKFELVDTDDVWTTGAVQETLQHWRDNHQHGKPGTDRPDTVAVLGSFVTPVGFSTNRRGTIGIVR